jgi:hypothetical protein
VAIQENCEARRDIKKKKKQGEFHLSQFWKRSEDSPSISSESPEGQMRGTEQKVIVEKRGMMSTYRSP